MFEYERGVGMDDDDNRTRMVFMGLVFAITFIVVIFISLLISQWMELAKVRSLEGRALEYHICVESAGRNTAGLCLNILTQGEE